MRFLHRKEFIDNAQRLVDELFTLSSLHPEFVSVSGNDMTVLCNGSYRYHAYIDEFVLYAFKRDVRHSMMFTRANDNTVTFLKFMTKLFGEEYVDAYEEWIKQRDVVAQATLASAEKRRSEELQDLMNTIDEVAFKNYSRSEFESKRKRMREEAKAQYLISKEESMRRLREDIEKQKAEYLANLKMLREMLND